jgi:hypothetical protein
MKEQKYLPPIRSHRQRDDGQPHETNQQRLQQQRPSASNDTPLVKAVVEQIKSIGKNNATGTSLFNTPDIENMIGTLKRYTFMTPLLVALTSSFSTLPSNNDVQDTDPIKVLYKEIEMIVWMYKYYKLYSARQNSRDAVPLSYTEFIQHVMQHTVVPTLQQINYTNQRRERRKQQEPTQSLADFETSNTIVDLLLCGTSISIPETIYDLPKVLYKALEETKYAPHTSSTGTGELSLAYLNRNRQLCHPATTSTVTYYNNDAKDKAMLTYYNNENNRYNMLYLYLLAHIAYDVTDTLLSPTPASTVDGMDVRDDEYDTSGYELTETDWKSTLSDIIGCHPPSSKPMHLTPTILAIVQLDWYCLQVVRTRKTKVTFASTAGTSCTESITTPLLCRNRSDPNVPLSTIVGILIDDK